jgi:TatD DNase family protein
VIDFHCHLDLYPNPKEVVRECIERNLYVLSVTTTPSAWQGTSALAQDARRIRTALGLHPQLAHERKHELTLFERFLNETRYVGEVGLDGSPDFKLHWADQIEVFTQVLSLCTLHGGRILSIHSRRAAAPVLDLLERWPGAGVPVLHWFSGTQRELTRAVALNCWFSVGPPMTESERGKALLLKMPRDRVLPESDGPFAMVRGRPAVPRDTGRVVDELAQMWQDSALGVQAQLTNNLRALVARLPGSESS